MIMSIVKHERVTSTYDQNSRGHFNGNPLGGIVEILE